MAAAPAKGVAATSSAKTATVGAPTPNRPALGDVKLKDTFTYLDTWCRGPANRVDSVRRVKDFMATSSSFRITLWTGVVMGIIISGWRSHYLGHSPHATPPAYQLTELRELHKELLYTPKNSGSSSAKH